MMMRDMRHCSFSGEDCYTVRVHPRIKTVSYNSGYTAGGQNIRLTGLSFNGTNVEVKVGGVDCEVTANDTDYIECTTGAASEISSIGYQPGQPGLTQIQTDIDYNEYLVLASTSEVMNLNSSHPMSGWWTAPADGEFRLYLSCDSHCTVNMNINEPFDASNISPDMPTTEVMAVSYGNKGYRGYYYRSDDGHYSDWFELIGGEQYYISMDGATEMTVGYEYRDSSQNTVTEVVSETCVFDHDSTDCTYGEVNCSCTTTTQEVFNPPHTDHWHSTKSMQQVAFN